MAEQAELLSFYVAVRDNEFADLEVVSAAAIQWAQAARAAARVIDPDQEYRVTLVAAERGSSKWLARIESSAINRGLQRVERGWKASPVVVRAAIGLAIVWPTTIKPSLDYWSGVIQEQLDALGLTAEEKTKAESDAERAASSPTVTGPKQQMYRTLQRDPKITGVGSGVPTSDEWRPPLIVPSNQFAEADGLFRQDSDTADRVVSNTMDVTLVSPRLEGVPRSWIFRQEGLPPFRATMRDETFLAAMERSAVKEQLRTKIPMTIRVETRQKLVNGEWRDVPRGRSVAEVIEPKAG